MNAKVFGRWVGSVGIVLLGSLGASLAQLAYAAPSLNSYSYWVRTAQTGQTCAAEAEALGARFAHVTGLQVKAAKCDGTSIVPVGEASVPLYSLEVTYLAPAPILTYTAHFGRAEIFEGPIPTDGRGIFTSASDCQTVMAQQVQLFEKQTGLSALSARCELGTWSPSDSFVLNIEGFGNAPAQSLQVADFAAVGAAGPALLANASALVNHAGGAIAGVWSESAYFYGESTLPLKVMSFGEFTTAQCAEQLSAAQAIYTLLAQATSSRNDSIVSCVPTESGQAELAAAYVSTGIIIGDSGVESAPFYSFDECMANVKRTVATAASNGNPALGALCESDALNPGQYIVTLYNNAD